MTIVWIMNRDHNMSAWTFGHLSAQSTVEYSMLTYLITYVASYSISSSYKNFDNWSYLHYHLVFFFFYLITYVASYSISSSYKNSDNWSYLHFFFFRMFICCLISVFETILAWNSHIEWNQYQWPTLVQKKLVLFKEAEMRYTLTFIYN